MNKNSKMKLMKKQKIQKEIIKDQKEHLAKLFQTNNKINKVLLKNLIANTIYLKLRMLIHLVNK